MSPCAVSIVLIVHNTAPWLTACFDSLAAQSFRDFEIVVVDVASGPRTKRALRRQLSRFGRVTLIIEEENVGGASAGNRGIRAATGDYVFIMDSDDVLPPDALKALHAVAARDSLDVTIGRPLALVGNRLTSMRYQADNITWAKELRVSDLTERPHLTMAPYYWGRLYSRKMLLQHDVFMQPGRLFADRYFTCKALQASRRTGVILDGCYHWRRSRGTAPRSRSITQQAADPTVLRARLASFSDVESLFADKGEADILRYVRLTNLMRLFIHARHLPNNPELLDEMATTALAYAAQFDGAEVASCEFMQARHKVQWFLMVSQRWDDLVRLQSTPDPASTPTTRGDELDFDYSSQIRALPSEFARQYRFKIVSATATVGNDRTLAVQANVPESMEVEPLHVVFAGNRPDDDLRVPIDDVRTASHGFKFAIPLPLSSERQALRRLMLEVEVRGRVTSQPIAWAEPVSRSSTE